MNTNTNLHVARQKQDNEFYTFLDDIERELVNYKDYFRNKIVYCNCDSEKSNFYIYFKTHFSELGLKCLVVTHLEEPHSYAISYNGINETKVRLNGTGGFNTPECRSILEACDIVVTNPPFSLTAEFVLLLMEYKKDFIAIGNVNFFGNRQLFPFFKDGKMHHGYTRVFKFSTPSGEIKRFGDTCWYTNLDYKKEYDEIPLTKEYNENNYSFYDNYGAINCDRIADIPKDYYGYIGVPVSYILKHNPNQFKIVGLGSATSKKNKLYYEVPYFEGFRDKGGQPMINGKAKFVRVFIQRVI